MLGKLYSEMIFNRGFVHSDPHPGKFSNNIQYLLGLAQNRFRFQKKSMKFIIEIETNLLKT